MFNNIDEIFYWIYWNNDKLVYLIKNKRRCIILFLDSVLSCCYLYILI